jgi:preprotein translocase subunit SecG
MGLIGLWVLIIIVWALCVFIYLSPINNMALDFVFEVVNSLLVRSVLQSNCLQRVTFV